MGGTSWLALSGGSAQATLRHGSFEIWNIFCSCNFNAMTQFMAVLEANSLFGQAFNLAIAYGVVNFHGQLIRALTSGQLPVVALMSSDNGKAQVGYSCVVLLCGFVFCHTHFYVFNERGNQRQPTVFCGLSAPRATSTAATCTSPPSSR